MLCAEALKKENKTKNSKLFLGYMEKPHFNFGFIIFRS